MPNCRDCPNFTPDAGSGLGPQCLLSVIPPGDTSYDAHKRRVRACDGAVLLKHKAEIRGDVLEVGAGASRRVRDTVAEVGAVWHAIDPTWVDNERRRTKKGKVSAIPACDATFDWVLSFSSMEHWNEFGDTIPVGLKEIHRVLKPGGKLLIAVPFHNHGADMFYQGLRTTVKRLFMADPEWAEVDFEEWMQDPSPLPGLQEWRREARRIPDLMKVTGGIEPTTSTLEIFAVK